MPLFNALTVQEITEVYTVPILRGKQITIQQRACYGLSFCTRGRIRYLCQGKEAISDPLHAVLLPQGATYHLECQSSGRFPLINFTATLPPGQTLSAPLALPLRHPERFLQDYNALQQTMLLRRKRAHAMALLYDLLAACSLEECKEEAGALGAAMALLEERYTDPHLSNATLAACAHISEVYFRRLFKETYATTPRQYLCTLRIRRAKQLLLGSDAPIGAIAEQCGFSSVYHFSRAFRTATGHSPSEWREQNGHQRI